MKIAITSQEKSIRSILNERFGKCIYFVVFDTLSGNTEMLESKITDPSKCTGMNTCQLMADNYIDVVISGHFGKQTSSVLKSLNIKMFTSIKAEIKDVIENFKAGKLEEIKVPTTDYCSKEQP